MGGHLTKCKKDIWKFEHTLHIRSCFIEVLSMKDQQAHPVQWLFLWWHFLLNYNSDTFDCTLQLIAKYLILRSIRKRCNKLPGYIMTCMIKGYIMTSMTVWLKRTFLSYDDFTRSIVKNGMKIFTWKHAVTILQYSDIWLNVTFLSLFHFFLYT